MRHCPKYHAARRGLRAMAPAMLAFLACVAAGCADPEPPVLGVASSARFLDAARLAVADAYARDAGVRVDTVMVSETTNEAGPAIATAERLLARPGLVAVAGHSNSSASITASQLYNAHQVVQLAPQASATLYSEAGPYSFRLVPPDDRQGAYLARHIVGLRPEGGTVAVFYVNDDYGRGLRRALVGALDTDRFQLVLDLPHMEQDAGAAQVDHAAGAVAAANPDIIVWLGRATVLQRYIAGFRTAAPTATVMGGDALAATDWTTWGHSALRGGIHHVDFLDLDATPALRDFAARYRSRFGRDAIVPDALTYDAVMLLIAGVEAGARTGPEMRAFLASLGRTRPPYAGITGPIEFDDAGDADRSYVVRLVGVDGA